MGIIKLSTITFYCLTAIFASVSLIIFNKVNLTSKIIIDEEFHLTIGEAYCKFDFNNWHPKVTTLPGLYLLSTLFFGFFELCSVYWLRLTSLICSIINVLIFYALFNLNNEQQIWKNIWSSINLALLPPLYFFGHLYYTDVPSLTMILLLLLFSEYGNHYLASIFGLLSVMFRQTNIIWVGMVFGCYLLKQINALHYKKLTGRIEVTQKEFLNIIRTIKDHLMLVLKRADLQFWLNVFCYVSLILTFLLFIIINGSIVVGDKDAHEATLNLPQIFYFSLFTLFFGWPHFLRYTSFLKFIKYNKLLLLLSVIICIIIVYLNTIVHPYLLADNRHYTFYIWNRFYGKYTLFRYIIIPVYIFAIYTILAKFYNPHDVTFLVFFIPCMIAVLVPQKLFEIRYFLIPYILLRLHMKNVTNLSLIYEFLTFIAINTITFYVFFTKTIQWTDYDYPQRLIW